MPRYTDEFRQEAVKQIINNNYEVKDVGKITASFGVTTFCKNENTDSFLKRVDDALYSAKISGKNKVVTI
ncbi:diguanylate cyclase domain-containing protein [Sulfuricurvum kujiense]|uniref:diguanylate cyclase domain-containing protein n=1 Tax=Sulfuricurvum kujiense TaxID=148813 RepID=UPI001244E642